MPVHEPSSQEVLVSVLILLAQDTCKLLFSNAPLPFLQCCPISYNAAPLSSSLLLLPPSSLRLPDIVALDGVVTLGEREVEAENAWLEVEEDGDQLGANAAWSDPSEEKGGDPPEDEGMDAGRAHRCTEQPFARRARTNRTRQTPVEAGVEFQVGVATEVGARLGSRSRDTQEKIFSCGAKSCGEGRRHAQQVRVHVVTEEEAAAGTFEIFDVVVPRAGHGLPAEVLETPAGKLLEQYLWYDELDLSEGLAIEVCPASGLLLSFSDRGMRRGDCLLRVCCCWYVCCVLWSAS